MPFGSVTLRPGVNVELTETANTAGYSSTDFVRFQSGMAQKIGGWDRFYDLPVSGVPRDLHAWQDINEVGYLASGSTTQLAAIANETLTDITPQTLTSDFARNFSTTIGSSTVTVNDANISTVTTNDQVFFNTPISVGGIILSGLYQITLVTGVTTYKITAATNATATVAAGGTVPYFSTTSGTSPVQVTFADHGLAVGNRVVFSSSTTVAGITIHGAYAVTAVSSSSVFTINTSTTATSTTSAYMNDNLAEVVYYFGLGPQAIGAGYGLGGYGLGGYGTGIVPSVQTGTPITSQDWTLDNWGSVLLSCTHNGGIYSWDPSGGFVTASLIPNAPIFTGGMFVSTQSQILVAWAASEAQDIGVDQDSLLVRNSDQEDFTTWDETTTNQARRFRIPTGSRIVGGAAGPKFDMIWTDLDLWVMEYVGFPLVFTYNKVGTSCGLIAQHAQAMFRGVIYWMGQSNFYRYGSGGGVEIIPCTVWDAVFQDLDRENAHKIRCAPNTPFNEIWWFYPSVSGGTGENDKYVKFNIVEGVWDFGHLGRTCWIDQSVLGNPIAGTTSGLLYQHEEGYDADGQPITATFTTGYFYLSEGQEYVFVDQAIPDFKWGTYSGDQNVQMTITFNVVDFPGTPPRTHGPYPFNKSTQYINTRFRGRQASMTVTSSDAGSFWRLGKVRFRVAGSGRR